MKELWAWLKSQWIEAKEDSKKNIWRFGTTEINAVGDKYEYKIEADSKEEAFKRLVEYFYGDTYPEVESNNWTVSQPHKDVFQCWGMPYWFARLISGHYYNGYNTIEERQANRKEDWEKLKEYALKNNITLKED